MVQRRDSDCDVAVDHRHDVGQLQRHRFERFVLRDIGSDDGHRECGANAGDHTERRDDVLQRRQRDADDANGERRNISMERWRERSGPTRMRWASA